MADVVLVVIGLCVTFLKSIVKHSFIKGYH